MTTYCQTGVTLLLRFRLDTVPGSPEMVDAWLDWTAHKADCGICNGKEVGDAVEEAAGNGRQKAGNLMEME